MAFITPDSYADVDMNSAALAPKITVTAGAVLSAGLPVQIRSDGLAYPATSTYVQTQTLTTSGSSFGTLSVIDFDGIAAQSYAVGEKATIFGVGTIFHLSTGLTPGNKLYVSGSSTGQWSTTALVSGDAPCAKVISTENAVVIR